jgi:hypothetical protein
MAGVFEHRAPEAIDSAGVRRRADPSAFVPQAAPLPALAAGSVSVGSVHDPAEAEADRVGDIILRAMAGPATHLCDGTCDHGGLVTSRVQRTAAASAATLHPSGGPEGGPLDRATEQRIRRTTGGEPLDPRSRPRVESALGQDLGDVRIHRRSALAPELGAEAFTFGNRIHLAPGAPDPSSASGRRLLAHELGHVAQQRGRVHRAPMVQRRLDGNIPFTAFKQVLDRSPKHRGLTNHRPSTGLGQFDVEYLHNNGPGQLIVTVKPFFEWCQTISGGVVTPGGWTTGEQQNFINQFTQQTEAAWSGKYQFKCVKPGYDHLTANVAVRVVPVTDVNQSHFHHRIQKNKSMGTGIGREQNSGEARNTGNFAEQDAPVRSHDSKTTCANIASHDVQRLQMLIEAFDVNPIRFSKDGTSTIDPASTSKIDQFVAAALRTERPGSVPVPLVAVGKHNKREGTKDAQKRAAALKAYIEGKAFKNNVCETDLYDTRVADQKAVYDSKKSALSKAAEKKVLDELQGEQYHREAMLDVKKDFQWAGDPYSILAHEFGHMLGNPDEYFTYGSATARDAKVSQLIATGKVEDAKKAVSIQARTPSNNDSHSSGQEAMSALALRSGVEIPEYGPTTSSIMSAGADVLPAHYLPLLEALSKVTDAAITYDDWKIV